MILLHVSFFLKKGLSDVICTEKSNLYYLMLFLPVMQSDVFKKAGKKKKRHITTQTSRVA